MMRVRNPTMPRSRVDGRRARWLQASPCFWPFRIYMHCCSRQKEVLKGLDLRTSSRNSCAPFLESLPRAARRRLRLAFFMRRPPGAGPVPLALVPLPLPPAGLGGGGGPPVPPVPVPSWRISPRVGGGGGLQHLTHCGPATNMASAGWGTLGSNRRAAARWLFLLLLTRAASTDVGTVVAEKARRAAVTRPVVLRLVLDADCEVIVILDCR